MIEGASNRLIDVESLSEEELQTLRKHYGHLARMAQHDVDMTRSHSVEEAEVRHKYKRVKKQQLRKVQERVIEDQ